MGTHPRRLVKVGLLTLISALSGVVAAELLRAISGHPLGRFPLELAFLTVAAATSAVITLTVILARWMRNVNEAVQQAARQQTALIAIRPLLGELPLPLGGWAIDAVFAELLVQTLTRERPRLVVECGSGSSTVLMAKVFRAIGRGRVVSLEHEAQYAQQTRELLKAHGVDEFADVLDSPLVERTVDSESMKWYDIDPLSLPDGGVDVLVVDGPPAILEHKARYPAVPLLWRHLSANCLILMDDGDREGEQEIAELWAATLGATLEYAPGGKGAWLLRNGGAVRHTQPAAEGPVSVVPRPRTEHEVRAAR